MPAALINVPRKARRGDVIDALKKAAKDEKDKTGRLQAEAKKALGLIEG